MSRATEPRAPVRVEIIAGQLSAQVVLHDIETKQGTIACWSYVTDGLAAHDHAELVFTLRRDPGEAEDGFPEDPLRLFSTIHQLAERGQRVTAGAQTEFGDRRFFDHHLLYAAAQPLAGVRLPAGCLAILLVTDDELRAVRMFGSARVLARMGQATTHYPFPPWSDRQRRGLSLDRTFEASLLAKIPRAPARNVHATLDDDRIVLSVLRSDQPAWQGRLAQVPDHVPLALLTEIDPTANGCLVWVPGQKEPEAIVPPDSDGSHVCGCFVAFIADQPANAGKILEDGFAMQLTAEAWQAIRRALIDGEELTIPSTEDGIAFALTWRDEVHVSPVDGAAYVAEGGWHTYAPDGSDEDDDDGEDGDDDGGERDEGDGAPPGARLAFGPLRLLTSQADLAARTSVEELGAFCREIQRRAAQLLGGHDGQLELRLQVICRPRSHRVGVSHRGEVSEQALDALIDALEQIPTLAVRGEVGFEMELSVSAGPRERFP